MVSNNGYRLFSILSAGKVEEIFFNNDEDTKIAERLFSSSLVAVVSKSEPNKLKVISKIFTLHFVTMLRTLFSFYREL